MKSNRVFLAATGNALARAESASGAWRVTYPIEGVQINCLSSDPLQPGRVFAGAQKDGVLISEDSGKTWRSVGLENIPVKSLAVSQHYPGMVFAGCKPVSLYMSSTTGETWQELESLRFARKWWWFSPADPSDWRPYVQSLAISPTDPNVIIAGIELGGVLRSHDRGRTWSGHCSGAQRDCHTMIFHNQHGDWVYEGGGGGSAYSRDGGKTWRQPKQGIGTVYGWAVAADPTHPEIWYLSASRLPSLLRGEFTPPAHHDGKAAAHIYRSTGGAPWTQLSGGLPDPLDYMAYALVTDPDESGHLYAGLSSGDIWHTQDYGDNWVQLPINLGGIHSTMIMFKSKNGDNDV